MLTYMESPRKATFNEEDKGVMVGNSVGFRVEATGNCVVLDSGSTSEI